MIISPLKKVIFKGVQQEKYKLAIVAGVSREGVKCRKFHKIQLKTKKAVKTTSSITEKKPNVFVGRKLSQSSEPFFIAASFCPTRMLK